MEMEVTRPSQAYCVTSPSLFIYTQNYSNLLDKLPTAHQLDCREQPSLHLKNFLEFNHIPCTMLKKPLLSVRDAYSGTRHQKRTKVF